MSIKLGQPTLKDEIITEEMENYTDDGIKMSGLIFKTLNSRYCGNFVKTLTIGGVATEPEYRRAGAVRQMFKMLFDMAPERGWIVSFLHPFSFSYYRKFGYEKVADHKIVEFPISKLEFVDRCSDLVPVNSLKRQEDCVKVYNKFADGRNIMFVRKNTDMYPINNSKKKTYLWYAPDGEPSGYVTLESEKYFSVNRMVNVNLNVYEMAYTSPDSLQALFGFLRMYEGENDTVKLHNCAMSPEIDVLLKHYMHTSYTLVPDIAARILDVPAILKLNSYPAEHGCFTVKVNDNLPYTDGVYRVEYQNGKADVARLPENSDFDLAVPMPAFTQLVYGYDEYTPDVVKYMSGAVVNEPNSDFFKAFHKKNNGLFEHF